MGDLVMLETWNERFELAKKYYEYHGNLNMGNFITKDGINYDKDGFWLGHWLNRQRTQHNLGQLTSEHREKLESIGFVFDSVHELNWNEFYGQLHNYLEHYHTLNIPKKFNTIDGINYDEKGKNLGAWWHVQKSKYNKGTLKDEQIKKIDKLYDILNEYEKVNWNKMYEFSKKYYERYNTLRIKQSSILIFDNICVDMEKLANWINKQRRDYRNGSLSLEKVEKLKQIGMIFENVVETEWERMYALASIYFKTYGNLKIPRNFKTKNGIDFDKNGSSLGKWLNAQYSNNVSGGLSSKYKQRLESIGMIFDNQLEKNWNEMLILVCNYLKEYGNLNVPINFITKDGITYDENGKKLGQWFNRQRMNGIKNTLSLEHRQKLESIGLIFKTKIREKEFADRFLQLQ